MANHVRTIIDGQTYYLKAESAIGIESWEHIVEINPESTQQNWLGVSNNFVDFVIRQSDIDRINEIKLKLVLKNTSGSSISLLPSVFLIDHHQLLVAKGKVIDEQFAFSTWLDTWMLKYDENEIDEAASMQGYNGTTLAPTLTIAAGATSTQYVDIPSLIDQIRPHYGIWPPGAELTVRVWFASGTGYYVTGAAGLEITYASLLAIGKKGPHEGSAEKDQDMNAFISNGSLDYRYLTHRSIVKKLTSKTSGQKDKIKMENVMGDVMWFTIIFRNLNPTGNDIINPLPFETYQIETSTSTNILGMTDIPMDLHKKILMKNWIKDCRAIEKINVYVHSWTPDIKLVWRTGAHVGGISEFRGEHYYAWVPRTTQEYQVDIVAYAFQILSIRADGKVEINPLYNK